MERRSIRELRENDGISQRDLARKIGVHHNVVYYWESGKRMPDALQLRRVAEALGVSMDEIKLPGESES